MLILVLAASLAQTTDLSQLREGPVDFRCDHGQAYSKPSRWVCRDNVIVRRGDLLVCCQTFEGYRTEAGSWNRFVCSGDVRAQRVDELMWAQKATFIVETNDLILTGKPQVQRAGSILAGERIVIDVKYDQARVEKPRGRLTPADKPVADKKAALPTGKLPERCTIPRAPASR